MKKYIIIILSIYTIFISDLNCQSIKKAYKALEKQDYPKAIQEFKSILSSDKSNPGALFGLTYLYGYKEFGYYDIFKAWDMVDDTKKSLRNLNSEDAQIINDYFILIGNKVGSAKYKMEKYIENIEQAMLRTMREENNLEVVYRFLEEYKDYERYDNIIHIRNYLEYRDAENKKSLSAIEEFLRKRPDAAQVELAMEKRNEYAFQTAKTKNTALAMNEFIEKYPGAIQIPEAITIRNRLEFVKVQQLNNFQAYQQYMEKFPNSTYIPKIRELQKKLMYEQAKRINTIEAYNKFISMYPDGAQFIDIFNLKTSELGKKFNSLNTEFTGAINWSKGFDNEEQDNIAEDLYITSNKDIIIAGATMQDDTSDFLNAWIIKLDSQHKLIWNKEIGERWHDIPKKVITDNENNIIIAGIINKPSDEADGAAWIFKLTPDGEKIWNRKFDMPEILAMDINSQGQIIVGGYQKNDSLPDSYVIYKLTKQGRKFWKRTYSKNGRVNDIKITDDNEIILAGDKWIWKINDQGYIVWETEVQPTDSITDMYVLPNGNIAFLGNRNKNECLIKVISPKGKPIIENHFAANATVCEPIDITANAQGLIFSIKLDNFYKLLYSDFNGNLTNEFDFNPNIVSNIAGLFEINTGGLYLLITADNLGQKKDIIITQLK